MSLRQESPSGHKEPLAVLIVLDALYVNGAVRVSLELARHWVLEGGRLAAVQAVAGAAQAAVPPGVRVHQLSADGGRLRRRLAGVLLRLVREARHADVVVAGSEIGVGLPLAYLAARVTRKPFIIAVHADLDSALKEWMPTRTHRLYYWLHRHADGAISVAPGLVPTLVRHGVDPGRVRVVRNGIDTEEVRRIAAAPSEYFPADIPTVVSTGRLSHAKGLEFLLRAHAKVRPAHPHRVLVLNDGPEREHLMALAHELGIEDTVRFEGAVPQPLPSVARADVFCLPSRHEGLPLALLEAVALGTPCIAADCSDGVRMVLDDGRVGDLVPVGDEDALSEALERHLGNPARLRAKAALGPQHAQSFDSAVMARRWQESIRELANQLRDSPR